jgi:hypothetical protein
VQRVRPPSISYVVCGRRSLEAIWKLNYGSGSSMVMPTYRSFVRTLYVRAGNLGDRITRNGTSCGTRLCSSFKKAKLVKTARRRHVRQREASPEVGPMPFMPFDSLVVKQTRVKTDAVVNNNHELLNVRRCRPVFQLFNVCNGQQSV